MVIVSYWGRKSAWSVSIAPLVVVRFDLGAESSQLAKSSQISEQLCFSTDSNEASQFICREHETDTDYYTWHLRGERKGVLNDIE